MQPPSYTEGEGEGGRGGGGGGGGSNHRADTLYALQFTKSPPQNILYE